MSAERPRVPDLSAAFDAAGLLDVAYVIEDSPLGPLLLAASRRGLLRVGFANLGHEAILAELARRISPRVLAAPARLDEPRRQLEAYFSRRLRVFDLPLDRRLIRPGFSGRVLTQTARIPYGETSSYARIAAAAGSERAFRAAGSALGANPLPLVIPCHRVLASNQTLGGYAGGTERKSLLLELERSYSPR